MWRSWDCRRQVIWLAGRSWYYWVKRSNWAMLRVVQEAHCLRWDDYARLTRHRSHDYTRLTHHHSHHSRFTSHNIALFSTFVTWINKSWTNYLSVFVVFASVMLSLKWWFSKICVTNQSAVRCSWANYLLMWYVYPGNDSTLTLSLI